jgi:hypothetical protein
VDKRDKPPVKSSNSVPASADNIELLPDAWEIFEKAVDRVAKSPPQHRTAAEKPKARARPPKGP